MGPLASALPEDTLNPFKVEDVAAAPVRCCGLLPLTTASATAFASAISRAFFDVLRKYQLPVAGVAMFKSSLFQVFQCLWGRCCRCWLQCHAD